MGMLAGSCSNTVEGTVLYSLDQDYALVWIYCGWWLGIEL